MTPRHRKSRRRAYTLVIVLMLSFIVIAFAGVLAALSTLTWQTQTGRESSAHLDQAIASAVAWSHQHAGELVAAGRLRLPLAGALPPEMDGAAELDCRSTPDGAWLVDCTVRVDDEGRIMTRHATWPLPS